MKEKRSAVRVWDTSLGVEVSCCCCLSCVWPITCQLLLAIICYGSTDGALIGCVCVYVVFGVFRMCVVAGFVRRQPTSCALDLVCKAKNIPCFETPTGWKFFGNVRPQSHTHPLVPVHPCPLSPSRLPPSLLCRRVCIDYATRDTVPGCCLSCMCQLASLRSCGA